MVFRICKICGKEYEVCPSCEAVRTFTPWRTIVCDPKEFIVYTTLSKYDLDKDAQAAAAELNDLGLTKKQIRSYIPTVKKVITEIYQAVED